ncbi:hypothetical protein [Amphritea sp. HPY]|uniref:hypothetical protein n=1 Tax=Amphritea sp. HPY TaxID=3421652 RepID=UPI003D7D3679
MENQRIIDQGNTAYQIGASLADNPYEAYSKEAFDWITGWAKAADQCCSDWKMRYGGAPAELPEDLESKSYRELILELKGEIPAWVCAFSDRTAYSLLCENFNSLQQVKLAVDEGLEIDQIPSLGRKEVAEVEQLLESVYK